MLQYFYFLNSATFNIFQADYFNINYIFIVQRLSYIMISYTLELEFLHLEFFYTEFDGVFLLRYILSQENQVFNGKKKKNTQYICINIICLILLKFIKINQKFFEISIGKNCIFKYKLIKKNCDIVLFYVILTFGNDKLL